MNIYGFCFQRKITERIDEEVVQLTIDVLFDFLLQSLVFCFLVLFYRFCDFPTRGKDSRLRNWLFLNVLSDLFVLEIKRLDWSSNVIVASDSLFRVFDILFVLFLDFLRLLRIASGWQVESENCFSLFQRNSNILLEIFNGQRFRILFVL